MATVKLPLIVITGPTASGKSGLALRLAEKWGGEIICADSRTVYKGMDIGTAKPTVDEQKQVPHWLLDIVYPNERFTVADFQRLARAAIIDIRSRGKIPFLVGGTGLYIDSVILDFQLGPEAESSERKRLEKLTIDELRALIKIQHIAMPENDLNKRYLVRCIEKSNVSTSSKLRPDDDVVVIALATEKDELRRRIRSRVDQMFVLKIVQETQRLFETYGADSEAMTGNIYRIVGQMLAGDIAEEQAKQLVATRDWRLAKRQITWLKRHDFVKWQTPSEAEIYVNELLTDSGSITNI